MKLNTLEEAKTRVTIPDLWRRYNLLGTPSKSRRCPWGEDLHASFGVRPDGKLWNDFGTGEGGDVIDFLARLCQLDLGTACRIFKNIAGGISGPTPYALGNGDVTTTLKRKRTFPKMESVTGAYLERLDRLRGIGQDGLKWATERGLLRFATLRDYRAWIVTDGEGVNAQARRLGEQCWGHLGGAKAYTLPGSSASWPLGIREALSCPSIALCEGGADFPAAHSLSILEQASDDTKHDVTCAPVAMLGASHRIHDKALPLFAGKRVRILCHADEVEQRSTRTWEKLLAAVGNNVDVFDFSGLRRSSGNPVTDLNDFLDLSADDHHAHPDYWRILP